MSYVVSFDAYQPAPREDGIAWTQAQINESGTADGPWTLIDTVTLDPVDADPANPVERSFTTDNATLPGGWYQIVFLDGSGNTSTIDPIQNEAAASVAYWPTVARVAELVPSRAKNAYGRVPTFDDTTQPSAAQVNRLIARQAGKLFAKFGEPPAALIDDAKEVVALRTAMLIELTFFADQIRSDRSPYVELKALYEEALADFTADRANLGADGQPGTDDDQAPVFWFPNWSLGESVYERPHW